MNLQDRMLPMPSAKEIKLFAKENNVSNADARVHLILQEKENPVVKEEVVTSNDQAVGDSEEKKQLRELAKNTNTIALGLVVEKRSSAKPAKGLPKLKKQSPIFRIDISLTEMEQLAETAMMAMPGVTIDDFAYILGDGLKEDAHLQNGEQFAAALCGYFVGTEGYVLMKEGIDNPDCKGAIIRLIPHKDGYVLRPADYIRSYEQVDQSFEKMKVQ